MTLIPYLKLRPAANQIKTGWREGQRREREGNRNRREDRKKHKERGKGKRKNGAHVCMSVCVSKHRQTLAEVQHKVIQIKDIKNPATEIPPHTKVTHSAIHTLTCSNLLLNSGATACMALEWKAMPPVLTARTNTFCSFSFSANAFTASLGPEMVTVSAALWQAGVTPGGHCLAACSHVKPERVQRLGISFSQLRACYESSSLSPPPQKQTHLWIKDWLTYFFLFLSFNVNTNTYLVTKITHTHKYN